MLQNRFIPACVGNARNDLLHEIWLVVHPRVCGERGFSLPQALEDIGSSPRVRGTRDQRCDVISGQRFIPACAGNALSQSSERVKPSVHPRVCGERTQVLIRLVAAFGSSPRVRGTPTRRIDSTFQPRFIPACAGNALIAAAMPSP